MEVATGTDPLAHEDGGWDVTSRAASPTRNVRTSGATLAGGQLNKTNSNGGGAVRITSSTALPPMARGRFGKRTFLSSGVHTEETRRGRGRGRGRGQAPGGLRDFREEREGGSAKGVVGRTGRWG